MADKDRLDYRDAVESYVVRLASKARAAGIHLILITQRPDRDALPGQIKANMSNKLCLRVASRTNSQIVLDENGAELLLGQGHLAAKLANERPSMQSGYMLAQVPFATEDELEQMADLVAGYWRERASDR
jgi:S-DNA-T family DNA segregation ATPase FtsK/SpoIIIE